jgi:hypothetical protein
MLRLQLGERVVLRGEVFVLRGVAPMSAAPRWVQLEHVETGETVDATAEELRPVPARPNDCELPSR